MEREVTSRENYRLDGDEIVVEISDTMRGFSWRLVVNGDAGQWVSYHGAITTHKGYSIVPPYFGDRDYQGDDNIPIECPFKTIRAVKQ